MVTTQTSTIDDYIENLPDNARVVVEHIRQQVHAIAPGVAEKISYGMPTFSTNRRHFIHIAAWRNHVSLYPIPDGDDDFNRDIAPFVRGRGTLAFPIDEPIPYSLIGRVIRQCLSTNATDSSGG
jgi:uncharacterized protein YdhG (YjbR/CyaY superfamily)